MSQAPDIARARAPELTAEHAYARALASALLKTLGPKKGQRLLGFMRDELAKGIDHATVIPIRGDRDRYEREGAAKIEAARRFEADLTILIRASQGWN